MSMQVKTAAETPMEFKKAVVKELIRQGKVKVHKKEKKQKKWEIAPLQQP